MDLKITSGDYKKELERIDMDNSVEQALYFIIQLLLMSILDERFWITDTSRSYYSRPNRKVILQH